MPFVLLEQIAQAANPLGGLRIFGALVVGVLQERRERQNLQAALDHLSDRELIDIGVTRGEIDYVASKRSIDPRGVYWAEHAGK